jgi:hypothetical protein
MEITTVVLGVAMAVKVTITVMLEVEMEVKAIITVMLEEEMEVKAIITEMLEAETMVIMETMLVPLIMKTVMKIMSSKLERMMSEPSVKRIA